MRFKPKYPVAGNMHLARVWLAPPSPREFAMVNPQFDETMEFDIADPGYRMYSGSVDPHEPGDDGEREFSEDQIEGAAVYMETQCHKHSEIGFGKAVTTLEEATAVVKALDKLWQKWDASGFDKQELANYDRNWRMAVSHFEGCDIYVDLDGQRYTFNENDEWEKWL